MSDPCPQPFCDGKLRSGKSRRAGKYVTCYRSCTACNYSELATYLPKVLIRTETVAKRAPKRPAEPELAGMPSDDRDKMTAERNTPCPNHRPTTTKS